MSQQTHSLSCGKNMYNISLSHIYSFYPCTHSHLHNTNIHALSTSLFLHTHTHTQIAEVKIVNVHDF